MKNIMKKCIRNKKISNKKEWYQTKLIKTDTKGKNKKKR